MGNQNSAPTQPVCLLDADNSHRCTESNPVVSYLKHLDEDVTSLLDGSDEDTHDYNYNRFRKIGDELVSKAVLHVSVADGQCFQVSRQVDDASKGIE